MDSQEELLRRASLAKPSDQVLGMYFSTVLSFIEAEGGAEKAAAIRKTRKVPKRAVPFLRYPAADFLDVLDGVASAFVAEGRGDYPAALHHLGMSIVAAFMDGPVGRTMIAMLGGSPHRMLTGAPAAYAATFTFGECRYDKLDASSGRLTFKGMLLGPQITLGIMKSGIEISCPAMEATTEIESATATTDFVMIARWKPKAP